MDTIDQFAAEAVRFETWAHSSEPDAGIAARNALMRITNLYLAALQLPPPFSTELETTPDVERIPVEESAKVTAYLTIPVGMYGEVFDPLVVPPEEPILGSIADDVVDIYRDVVTGLRAYQSGNRAGALWEWGDGLRRHWGEHATGAIRALHAWLSANDFNRLSEIP